MIKIKTKCGYTAYEVSREEIMLLGGFGICDHCNTPSRTGYLVPVLNHWICPKCYAEWNERAKFYPEDLEVEARNCAYYESIIPLGGADCRPVHSATARPN